MNEDEIFDDGLEEVPQGEQPKEEPPKEEPPKAEPPKEEPKKDARTRALEQIAAAYAIREEQFDPRQHLPQYAARLYLDVYEAVMGAILQQMPTFIQQTLTARQAEEQFYQEFPMLRDPKYRQSIIEAAKIVAASGEKLTPEQARERIGRMVMAMHNLSSSRPVRPPRPVAPAASSGGRAETTSEADIWASLLMEE